ncbi:hypothetical protein AAFG13_17715 [Bradyrhizobium sp. B124]|uniref:hypothetical protein n=1 Tax=Bradyrhizobium sp. B124 TaxID=3140245 RepID=UPI003183DF5B
MRGNTRLIQGVAHGAPDSNSLVGFDGDHLGTVDSVVLHVDAKVHRTRTGRLRSRPIAQTCSRWRSPIAADLAAGGFVWNERPDRGLPRYSGFMRQWRSLTPCAPHGWNFDIRAAFAAVGMLIATAFGLSTLITPLYMIIRRPLASRRLP